MWNKKKATASGTTKPGLPDELATPFIEPKGGSEGSATGSAEMSQVLLQNEPEFVAPSGVPNAFQQSSTPRPIDVKLGQIVTLFMSSPQHKHYSLADLESFHSGTAVPIGVAFWTRVSAAVDQRLSDVSVPWKLQADEWNSGDIPWLLELAANARAEQLLLKYVGETAFKGREIKMRMRDADGKIRINTLKGTA
jgi:cytolysin-activating lysine-acyltransferase